MADPHTPPRRSGVTIALIAIGLLILVPSGLCSAFFGITFLRDVLTATGEAAAYARGFIWLVPMFGGPPIVLGALLLWLGLRRRRRTIPPVR
ncbi:MAG TPA: hypothetical protein VGU20_16425 [Stellaceae bacterium]|nr:hypothetical protein [Stellaceae bacterium]